MTQKLQTYVLALNQIQVTIMCFANSKVKKQAMKSVVKVDISIELQTFDETLRAGACGRTSAGRTTFIASTCWIRPRGITGVK